MRFNLFYADWSGECRNALTAYAIHDNDLNVRTVFFLKMEISKMERIFRLFQ